MIITTQANSATHTSRAAMLTVMV